VSDELLLTLSRRRETVNYATFRRYLDELATRQAQGGRPEVPEHHAAVTLNVLVSLGHAVASFAGGHGTVAVAPRVLARLPTLGRPRAVLVGHRTADTERDLHKACAAHGADPPVAENDDADVPLAPRRLLVEADTSENLDAVAKAVEARYHPEPAAWRVLHFAAALGDYWKALPRLGQRDINWKRSDFNPQTLRFESAPGAARDGLAELLDPQQGGRRRYRLRKGDEWAWVDRDWGRYAALADAGQGVLYRSEAGDIAVPVAALLPAPYAACLALCSGHAPRPARLAPPAEGGARRYLVYRNVPDAVADLAASKLKQRIRLLPTLEGTSCC
jgi:hypothetical protein